jgi:pimeloyl-ACP methyl ester carboxylesterase
MRTTGGRLCRGITSAMAVIKTNRSDMLKTMFPYGGREWDVRVVKPGSAAPGRPWMWRPEFFGAFDAVDQELVRRGWHLLFLDLPNQYGSPFAREAHKEFLKCMVETHRLSQSGVFIGLSRGGLAALHLAMDNPERCQALYLDNPVCDFRSWPGGMDGGPGNKSDWANLLAAYDISDAAARSHENQPLSRLTHAFIREMPLALVGGLKDEIVPWETNGGRLVQLWREVEGPLWLETKPNGYHHPHGPTDIMPIVEFLKSSL